MLFNEPEVLAAIGVAIGTEADVDITIEEHERRKRPGKKAIPENFPRIPVILASTCVFRTLLTADSV